MCIRDSRGPVGRLVRARLLRAFDGREAAIGLLAADAADAAVRRVSDAAVAEAVAEAADDGSSSVMTASPLKPEPPEEPSHQQKAEEPCALHLRTKL